MTFKPDPDLCAEDISCIAVDSADETRIYACDSAQDCVRVVRRSDGKLVNTLMCEEGFEPRSIAIDTNGDVYVAEDRYEVLNDRLTVHAHRVAMR